MKEEETDGFQTTVSDPSKNGNYLPFYKGRIEEDVWIPAVLKEIRKSKASYKGNERKTWSFIYELQDPKYQTEDNEQCIVREKNTRTLSQPPRESKAYNRYVKLTGKELMPGDNVNIKELEGIKCKIMISNSEGDRVTFHNIEKVTTKGVDTSSGDSSDDKLDAEKDLEDASKAHSEEKTQETKNKTTTDEEDDLFEDIFD